MSSRFRKPPRRFFFGRVNVADQAEMQRNLDSELVRMYVFAFRHHCHDHRSLGSLRPVLDHQEAIDKRRYWKLLQSRHVDQQGICAVSTTVGDGRGYEVHRIDERILSPRAVDAQAISD